MGLLSSQSGASADRRVARVRAALAGCPAFAGLEAQLRSRRIEIADAAVTRLERCRDGSIALAVREGDERFAAALIGVLLGDPDRPVVVVPESLALLSVAEQAAARDISILVQGPTGTGKQVLARFIHGRSPRRDFPLVAVNCAALPEAMLEALLFGHERGAFTGASGASPGLFRAANRGTLFLDEIGELPLGLQAKLLRALQEREVLPLGATTPVPCDIRLIAASNRSLASEAMAGRFRADLYYRIAVFKLATAPLAQRPADLDALIAALLLRGSDGDAPLRLPTAAARARLAAHDWPGNVRELDNVLQRAAVLAQGEAIDAEHIVLDDELADGGAREAGSLGARVRASERDAIAAALEACAGRRADTARRLGISERTLRYKLAAMSRQPAHMVLQ